MAVDSHRARLVGCKQPYDAFGLGRSTQGVRLVNSGGVWGNKETNKDAFGLAAAPHGVRWSSRRGPEFTWEREDQFRKSIRISSQEPHPRQVPHLEPYGQGSFHRGRL
ncbi:hypothetical protein Tco_0787862 [Tanacetum coccineum]